MRINIIYTLFLCSLFAIFCDAQTDSKPAARPNLDGITILWDRASGEPSWTPSGEFQEMGRELQRMGLNIKELNVAQQYTDEILEGIDIVVAILRFNALFKEEQQALVRYVRNGGSLLVLAKYTETLGTMAPVIVNFGLVIEDIFIDRDFLNDISFPCTTDDIPVENCRIFFPRNVT